MKSNHSIERAADILRALTQLSGEASLTEISTHVKMPPSTVYRLLKTLEGVGFVERSETDPRRYHIGFELFRLGVGVLDRMGLGSSALPYMQKLAELSQETVNLATLREFHVIYLEKIESPQVLSIGLHIGATDHPAHCTATGKALLAALPPTKVDELLAIHSLDPRTPNTITDRTGLDEELERIRRQGYAIDYREYHMEVSAIAAPIRGHKGRVFAALGTTGPVARLTRERLEALAPQVRSIAGEISQRLGYFDHHQQGDTHAG